MMLMSSFLVIMVLELVWEKLWNCLAKILIFSQSFIYVFINILNLFSFLYFLFLFKLYLMLEYFLLLK